MTDACELEGKVIVLTGAAAGIGLATARACVAAGARLLVNDVGCGPDGTGHDPQRVHALAAELTSAGGEVIASDADVAADGAGDDLIASAVARFGRIDGLVCNAGFAGDALLLRQDDEAWERMLDVHLHATMRLNRAAARRMVEQGDGGSLINTAAHAGLFGGRRQTALAAATAGVVGLTRSLSIELRRHAIRVNAVVPVARTRLTEELPMFKNIRADSMTPGHVAPVHVFLLSDLARDVQGELVGVAGARVYAIAARETTGVFFEEGPPSADDLATRWPAIMRS